MNDGSDNRFNLNVILSVLCAVLSLGIFWTLGRVTGLRSEDLFDESISSTEVSSMLIGAFVPTFLSGFIRSWTLEWSGWKAELEEVVFSCVLYTTLLVLSTWLFFEHPANGGIWGSMLQLPLAMGAVFTFLSASARSLAFYNCKGDEFQHIA